MTASEVRESLRTNLVAYLTAPDPLQKFAKLGDLLILAAMGDIEVADLQGEYASLLGKYALSKAAIRGAPNYLSEVLQQGWYIAQKLFTRMPKAILVKASEEAAKREVDLAEVVRRLQGGEMHGGDPEFHQVC